MKFTRLLTTIIAAACLAPASATLAQVNWIGGNGDFFDLAHWDSGAVPGPADTAVINDGSTATIAADAGTRSIGAINLGNVEGGTESGHVIMNGGLLKINADGGNSKAVIGLSTTLSTFIMNGGTILFDGPDREDLAGSRNGKGNNELDWEVGERGLGRFEMHNDAVFRAADDLKIAENALGTGYCLIDGNAKLSVGSGISVSSGGENEQILILGGNALVEAGNSLGAGNPAGFTDEGYLTLSIGAATARATVTVQDNAVLNFQVLSSRAGTTKFTVKNNGQVHIFDVLTGKGYIDAQTPPDRPVHEGGFKSSLSSHADTDSTLTLQDNAQVTVNSSNGLGISGPRDASNTGGKAIMIVRDSASFRIEQHLALGAGTQSTTSDGTLEVVGPNAKVSIGSDLNMAVDTDGVIASLDVDELGNPVPGKSTLRAVITSATHSTVNVGGIARIANGQLTVKLDGFAPAGGEVFTLIKGGTVEGQFAKTDFSEAPLAEGLSWAVEYTADSVLLKVTGTAVVPKLIVQDPGNVVGTGDTAWSYLVVEGEDYSAELDETPGVGFTRVDNSGAITSFLGNPVLGADTTASKKGALWIQPAAKHGDKVSYYVQFAKPGTYYLYMRFSMFETTGGETTYLNEDSFFVPPDWDKDPQTDWPLMDAGGQNGGYTEGCCDGAGFLFIPEKGGEGVRVNHSAGDEDGRAFWEGNFHWNDLISSQFLNPETQGEPRVRRQYEVTAAQVGKPLKFKISNREPGLAVDLFLFSTNPDLMDKYSQEELDQIFFPVPARTITVTTVDNVNPPAGKVSLLQAMTGLQEGDTIKFSIDGDGPHVIATPAGGYPLVTVNNVTIDGYSQPGSSPNTNPILAANNAKIKIVLDSQNGNVRLMDFAPTNPNDSTGYGDTEAAVIGILGAKGFHVQGVSILAVPVLVGGSPGGEDVGVYGVSFAKAASGQVSGCWIGVAPDGTTLAGPADAITGFRYRVRDESNTVIENILINDVVIGVKAGAGNARAEFNVIAGIPAIPIIIEGDGTRISGNFLNVLPSGLQDFNPPIANPDLFTGTFEGNIEIGRGGNNTLIGVDGDGVNDADERNVLSGAVPEALGGYDHNIEFYGQNPGTGIVIAGNYIGLGVDGVTRFKNGVPVLNAPGGSAQYRFGSDFDGVSDGLEGNVCYNNSSADEFPADGASGFFDELSTGGIVGARGNVLVKNNPFPVSPVKTSGADTFWNAYYTKALVDVTAGVVPVLSPDTSLAKLIGKVPVANAEYPTTIIDLYAADPEGIAYGQGAGLAELPNGFVQGKVYMASFVDNSAADVNKTAGEFEFDIRQLELKGALLTITANYVKGTAGTHNAVTLTSPFAEPVEVTFKPGSIESVGLTRIVADTPIINQGLDKLGNWEPYISVLGNSTFLLEGNAFALGADNLPDGVNQRFVVLFQPAAGGAPQLGEAFFADDGTPFRGQINLSRQNGNPGRVAGDKRPGAVNFMTGAEASPHGITEFQSEPNRWNLGFDRLADGRYGTVQTFKLDVATLAQTALSKAQDSANGRLTSGDPQGNNQITRFGGELAALDNGNFVSVVEDRSRVLRADGNCATATIFAPDGSVVTESWKVADGDLWSNVAAYKGGFAVRVGGVLYFYNNAGELQGTADQNTATGSSFDRGRGDGVRIAGHINSPYVFLAGKLTTENLVRVVAWDSRDRSYVGAGDVSEGAFTGGFDRANLAVDALNRVVVSWVSQPAGYEAQQVAARVLVLNEATKTITALTKSFLPFINEAPTGGIRTLQMSVAVTTKQVCIAAKGEINLENKPQNGPVINPLTGLPQSELNFYTVFTHPDPKDDPTPPVPPVGPGKPDENGMAARTATTYINTLDTINNLNLEGSNGIGITSNGNVVIGWEDDGDTAGPEPLKYLAGVWTLLDGTAKSITPDTTITGLAFPGQTLTSRFLSYFRKDGSAIPGYTGWGPKIKANLFGEGFGMGANTGNAEVDLGVEVVEFAAYNEQGGFPGVQLVNNSGSPLAIVAGVTPEYSGTTTDAIRIGDWDYLSNGNVVIVGESRQKDDLVNLYGGSTPANHAIFRIVDKAGNQIKEVGLVSETPDGNEIWHGVGVTKDGFAVRFNQGGAKVRLFGNDGSPKSGNLDLATITGKPITGTGGRGDGIGFHGNGKDAYVLGNQGNDEQGVLRVWVTVLNADGTVRYSRSASDDMQLTAVGRLDAAIHPSGHVIVVYDAKYVDGPAVNVALGRLLDPAGDPVGRTFYLSEKEVPSPDILESRRPRVAWRDDCAAVVWESRNSGQIVEENPVRVLAVRIFNVGEPGGPVTPITIGGKPTVAAGKINLAWAGGKGPFTVQKTVALNPTDWVDVLTTPDRTASVNLEGGQGFLRVVDRVTFTVTLSGAAERPTPVTTAGTGSGTLMLDGNKLTVDITYSGLTGTVSAGHIHGPATAE
ncbi:MAG: CHRD domain-containing protein, partial [Verrucomicrobia bacterium]|nr:CHRD domain-containing protein [Verrucomicrobiota bacterium]